MRKHAQVVADMINENRFETVAEVGVWKGDLAMEVLWACPSIEEYWAIDSWHKLPAAYPENRMSRMTQEEWDRVYTFVAAGMLTMKALRLLRLKSAYASTLFHDGYFDMVFIDGDHSYNAVKEDVRVWDSKVKPGGFIAGHDFIRKIPGVGKAIMEFYGDKVERLPATCWRVQK